LPTFTEIGKLIQNHRDLLVHRNVQSKRIKIKQIKI